jgi:small-conductance mechanosensitive channel
LKTSQSQRGREISQSQQISSDGGDFNQVNSSLDQVNSSLNQVNSSLDQVNSSLNQVNSSLNQVNSSLNGTNSLSHSHWQVPIQGSDMDQDNRSRTGMNQSHPCCTHHSSRQEQSREATYKHGLDISHDNKRPQSHYVYLTLVCVFFIGLVVMLLFEFAKLDNPTIHISSMAKKMMSWARGFRQNDQPIYEPVFSVAHP